MLKKKILNINGKTIKCMSYKNIGQFKYNTLLKNTKKAIYLKNINCKTTGKRNFHSFFFIPPATSGGKGPEINSNYMIIAIGHFIIMFIVGCLTIKDIDMDLIPTFISYYVVSLFFPLYMTYYILLGIKHHSYVYHLK
jgi:hypothetical protein